MRDVISSYDNTNDMATWRSRSLTANIAMRDAALLEMKAIAHDLKHISETIDHAAGDRSEMDDIVAYLREKSLRLCEANRRYHYFAAEVDSLG